MKNIYILFLLLLGIVDAFSQNLRITNIEKNINNGAIKKSIKGAFLSEEMLYNYTPIDKDEFEEIKKKEFSKLVFSDISNGQLNNSVGVSFDEGDSKLKSNFILLGNDINKTNADGKKEFKNILIGNIELSKLNQTIFNSSSLNRDFRPMIDFKLQYANLFRTRFFYDKNKQAKSFKKNKVYYWENDTKREIEFSSKEETLNNDYYVRKRFNWVSFSSEFSTKRYDIFDEWQKPENRFEEQRVNMLSGGISFNLYRWWYLPYFKSILKTNIPPTSFYFTAGYNLKTVNNADAIGTKQVYNPSKLINFNPQTNKLDSLGVLGNVEERYFGRIQKVSKHIFYANAYIEAIPLWFINVSVQNIIQKDNKPFQSFRLGVHHLMKNNEGDSVLNIGAYCQLNSDDALLIGVTGTLPINF